MRYRALTVSREYGSGGAEIAAIVARYLGWRLIDKEFINEISRRKQVSIEEAVALDEKIDPWIHRVTRNISGIGGEGALILREHPFDAEEAASITKSIIEEAYEVGGCVMVGRGSQCILQYKEDVFHAFIYGRWEERLRRIQRRVKPGTNARKLIHLNDLERMEYVRLHFNRNRLDPNLYDLMIDSKDQPEKVARLIISAMRMVPAMMAAS